VLIEVGGIYLKIVADEPPQVGTSVAGFGQQLDSVAGAQNHTLFNSGMRDEPLASFGQARFGQGQAFPHLDRRGFVIDADELEIHEMNL
jgi:hypothetical protein